MPRPKQPAVAVLISGGLDSAILCVNLSREYSRIAPIYIRSGLRWEAAEIASLKRFLSQVGHEAVDELVVLDEPTADVYGTQHWSTDGPNVPGSESADEAVYLPGRNILLTVKAAVWCRLRQISTLALGSLGTNPFPDSTPEFFRMLEDLLNRAMGGDIRLIRPFDHLHKAEVILRGQHLPLHLTFSCINPVGGLHCGVCNKCAERKKGFGDAGLRDLTRYHDEVAGRSDGIGSAQL